MSHSPGPWVHEYRSGDDPRNVSHSGWGTEGLWDADGNLILGADFGWDASYMPPKNPADIKLLQAAPDMLKMLKKLYYEVKYSLDLSGELAVVISNAGGFQ